MIGIVFIAVVIAGQTALLIGLFNRRLMNADAGWRRAAAMIASPLVLVVIPAVALVALHRKGFLAEALEPTAALPTASLALVYTIGVALMFGRYLWVSLVALPRRKRPSAVAAHCRSIHGLEAPGRSVAGTARLARAVRAVWRINCRFDLEVNRYFLRFATLPPSFQGYAIAHLSDLHVARRDPERWLDHIADAVAREKPDLILITGDFVAHASDIERLGGILPRLHAPDGVWAIRGNHDFWDVPEALPCLLEKYGVGVLGGTSIEIRRGSGSIVLVGIESPWNRDAGPRGCRPFPADRLTIVASHTPDNAPAAARCGADLVLAGHTHGGQIRLPVIGSVIVPSRYGKRYDQGWFALGATALYVNRGIGTYAPAIRLRCRPEVALFILCPAVPDEGAALR